MEKTKMIRKLFSFGLIACTASLIGCSSAGSVADGLNPYGQGNTVQTLGSRDLSSLRAAGAGGGNSAALSARHALEVMGTYRRAQAPEPAYPTIRPAEVRLMWVPDHLNREGNLVTAHYYYLRIMNDRWAVQDAFEIEGQLNGTGPSAGRQQSFGAGGGSSTPWVYKEE